MDLLYLRVLSCLLVPAGLFALTKGIRILRKTINTQIVYEGPADAQLRTFAINTTATYAVWQKGAFFGRTPNSQVQLTIRNDKTGERLRLFSTAGHSQVSNGSQSRIQLYSFFAVAGIYSIVATESGKQRNTSALALKSLPPKRADSPVTRIQIRDYQPAYHMVFAILFLLAGAFSVIGGIVFISLSFMGNH